MNTLKRIDKVCAVKQEGGWNSNVSSRFSNADLDPVPENKRTWTGWDVASYWASDQFAPATWDLGATLVGFGLCAREAIPLSFVAFLVIGIVLTINGRIGATLHCTFPVIARSSFGMYGAYAPILVRSILALLWLVILTYQGGRITAVMISAIWPSFSRIENTLPEGLGITTQEMVGFLILWVFQAPLACVPVVRLKWFFRIKAYISIILFLGLFIWGIHATKGQGFLLTGHFDEPKLPHASRSWAMVSGLNAVTGLYSTVSINIPDFSRFARSNRANWSQIIAVPVTGTIPIAVSIICAQAARKLYGVEVFDPASLCGVFDSRAAQFFSAFGFWVSTIGVNISANSVSFATDICSIAPRYLTIFRTSILAGILCWATCPWKIVTDAPSFISFLSSYPVFLAPIATILATDFFVVRRGKVDVRQLYDPKGVYAYKFGCNWRAFAAWIFAFAPNLPSFAHAIDASNPDPQPWTYMFSWYFSTICSFFWYCLFSYVFPPRSSFVDEAVYEVYELEYENSRNTSTAGDKVEEKEHDAGIVPV
ncbi:hypothetical protein JCM6882_001678 [Rhodosporidiobolus microsporus]